MFYNLQFAFWYLLLGSILTYITWGFIVAFEVLLAMNGSRFAIAWIRKHYKYTGLYNEVNIFYPMIWIGYFLLEIIPHYLWGEPKIGFNMDALFETLFDEKER